MVSKSVIGIAAGALLAASVPANAEDSATKATSEAQPLAAVQPPENVVQPAVLSDEELKGFRGGESVVLTNQTLVAITSGNVINGDYSAGNVSLSDNALSNFNGLGNLLINTGAQVSLQTGMNVTINVRQ